ncbi:Molybdenum cofactor sulfurase, C-terminal [Cynara cardunculus var. scolymus]|uniref:Molybdenum cofactor sulfurase, C-terminal n=1 Tax=Cynara cardunculus var. scolymus TaxID=59895 RepID=A0A103XQD2_CYNCS|nr:Molybdenum cofactor sulfurase, C-terminal [Cynara cardunculus var. scolymus]
MAEVDKDGGSAAAAGGGGKAPTVKSIFVYPIKSCRGISVSQALLCSTGFVWDRQWVVVNSKGRGCTQRVEPKLALIQVELPIEAFSQGWVPKNTSYLVVRAPGMAELMVPLTKPSLQSDGVSVWEWSGTALDEGDKAAKCIFVDGCEPFAEDLWKQIKINELTFQGVMLCPRCKVPTINQEDAMQGSEPTETMMKFRSAKALEVNATKTKYKGRVYLGQMLVCEDKDSSWRKVINVGDIIHVEKILPSYADVAV